MNTAARHIEHPHECAVALCHLPNIRGYPLCRLQVLINKTVSLITCPVRNYLPMISVSRGILTVVSKQKRVRLGAIRQALSNKLGQADHSYRALFMFR